MIIVWIHVVDLLMFHLWLNEKGDRLQDVRTSPLASCLTWQTKRYYLQFCYPTTMRTTWTVTILWTMTLTTVIMLRWSWKEDNEEQEKTCISAATPQAYRQRQALRILTVIKIQMKHWVPTWEWTTMSKRTTNYSEDMRRGGKWWRPQVKCPC